VLKIKFTDKNELDEKLEFSSPTEIKMKFEADSDMSSPKLVKSFVSFMKAFGYCDQVTAKGLLEVAYELEADNEANWMREYLISQGESGIKSIDEVK